jgi:hypothetical protein
MAIGSWFHEVWLLPTEIVIILLGWRCGFIRPWGRGKFEDKRIEVRLGYYIIGKKPKLRGRWVWVSSPRCCHCEIFGRSFELRRRSAGYEFHP